MGRKRAAPWGNRIVGTGAAPAGQLLANPANWRIHPIPQQEVLSGMLDHVGYVAPVIVNKRTSKEWGAERNVETLVDGHLRVELALSRGEDTEVPVAYVDLEPDEERSVLATLDPIGALAATDHEKLNELVAAMPEDLRELTQILREDRKRVKVVAFDATENYRVVVECKTATDQEALLLRLTGEGFSCRVE